MTRVDWECRVLIPEALERRRIERRVAIRDGLARARREADRRRYLDNCRIAAWMETFTAKRMGS